MIGSSNDEVVFKLDSSGNETVLFSFKGSRGDGAFPTQVYSSTRQATFMRAK
jgi:hypothetical protein